MIKKIANVFYDKEVSRLLQKSNIDAEGGITNKGYSVDYKFKGNVNFSNCKQIQEEYGLDYNIDISITSYVDTDIAINDIIKYDNVIYNVTDVLRNDSHILIVATKWRQ